MYAKLREKIIVDLVYIDKIVKSKSMYTIEIFWNLKEIKFHAYSLSMH